MNPLDHYLYLNNKGQLGFKKLTRKTLEKLIKDCLLNDRDIIHIWWVAAEQANIGEAETFRSVFHGGWEWNEETQALKARLEQLLNSKSVPFKGSDYLYEI